MNKETGVRFLLDEKNMAGAFVYRPINVGNPNNPEAQNATIGVKFAQGAHFLDPWGFMLIGKTKWQRAIFRLKHPIVYSKRGLRQLYRKIRRLFIKDRMIPCVPMGRVWKSKEELLKQYPEVKNGSNGSNGSCGNTNCCGNNQKQKNASQSNQRMP